MSNSLLLGIGTIIFGVTVWATLVFGYSRFGAWYDRDVASEFARRRDNTPPDQEVATRDLPHDDMDKVRRVAQDVG